VSWEELARRGEGGLMAGEGGSRGTLESFLSSCSRETFLVKIYFSRARNQIYASGYILA